MLDNGQVETQQIKDIQEDIDNYIENSQEPEFYENEYIYDDISGLDAMLLDVSPDCEVRTELNLLSVGHRQYTISIIAESLNYSTPIYVNVYF